MGFFKLSPVYLILQPGLRTVASQLVLRTGERRLGEPRHFLISVSVLSVEVPVPLEIKMI